MGDFPQRSRFLMSTTHMTLSSIRILAAQQYCLHCSHEQPPLEVIMSESPYLRFEAVGEPRYLKSLTTLCSGNGFAMSSASQMEHYGGILQTDTEYFTVSCKVCGHSRLTCPKLPHCGRRAIRELHSNPVLTQHIWVQCMQAV